MTPPITQNPADKSIEAAPSQGAESVVPQGLPFKPNDAFPSALGVSSSWVGLAIVLIGIWLFVIAKHRRQPASSLAGASLMRWLRAHSRSDRDLATRGQVQLNGHTTVHVIRWDGQEFLIGATAQSVSVLASRPAAAADDSQRPLNEVVK